MANTIPDISLEQLRDMVLYMQENIAIMTDGEASVVLWAYEMLESEQPITMAEAKKVQSLYNAMIHRQFAG